MIIKVAVTYKLYDREFLFRIACNDYIVAISKTKDKKIELLKDLNFSHFNKGTYDLNTFLMPIFTHSGYFKFYVDQGYSEEFCLELNSRVVLSSLTIKKSSDHYTDTLLSELILKKNITKLFDHIRGFIFNKKISEYKTGYKELINDIKDTCNEITKHIRDRYPDAKVDDDFLEGLQDELWQDISRSVERTRTKVADTFVDLLKTPLLIRVRGVEIKLNNLIGLISLRYGAHDYKKTKSFLINTTISSFISTSPINLWQLSNGDALSLLVKPDVEFAVIRKDEFYNFAKKVSKNKVNKMISKFIEPGYYLMLLIGYRLLKRVSPIIISINISTLSLLLRSKSVKNFWIALYKVYNNNNNNMYEKIKQWMGDALICNRLSI